MCLAEVSVPSQLLAATSPPRRAALAGEELLQTHQRVENKSLAGHDVVQLVDRRDRQHTLLDDAQQVAAQGCACVLCALWFRSRHDPMLRLAPSPQRLIVLNPT